MMPSTSLVNIHENVNYDIPLSNNSKQQFEVSSSNQMQGTK